MAHSALAGPCTGLSQATVAVRERSVWCSRPPARSSASSGRQQRPARAQALGPRESSAEELRRVPRGSAAAPLRVTSVTAEPAAPAAAQPDEQPPACRCVPGLGHAPVTMEQVSTPVAADMDICRQNLLNVVGERHPMLLAAANQIFSAGGKRLRPLIVLLVARATYPLTGLRCVVARGCLWACCVVPAPPPPRPPMWRRAAQAWSANPPSTSPCIPPPTQLQRHH